ncbi:Alpha/Beta hydrolase protein [Podospora australis]|uniref:Kynurenine formamidase n=1 Tax=Podospora australis TaxID=1536484 RepID=A0AAN6WQ42_9PEZI|nr:Alpha/Beta hydrolase protein [Podospora australis]
MWRRLKEVAVKLRGGRHGGVDSLNPSSTAPGESQPVLENETTAIMATEQDKPTWAAVPWTPVNDKEHGDKLIGWHKAHVPYVPGSDVFLQSLHVWLPASVVGKDEVPDASVPLPSSRKGRWVVYIHGGAWRDPKIDASSFAPTAIRILQAASSETKSGSGPIAGVASLNYRLSPHPEHPTDKPDPSREAKHPDHISDVLAGLSFLQRLGGASGKWVLSGHSCGATLAFQAVMDPSRWGLSTEIAKPAVIVGLNGLYDLYGFITAPPAKYAGLRDAYEEFVSGAFGEDRDVWKKACPATAEKWADEWKGGKRVVLVQSREDTLVPYDQLEKMGAYLSKSSSLDIKEMQAGGDHDDIWQKGDRLAEILYDVALGL